MSDADANTKTSIERFDAHLGRMRFFLEYIFGVQQIVPKIASKVPKSGWKELGEDIEQITYLTRMIYKRPELGSVPPDPLPVDNTCPEYLISDHIRERLGRNHAVFDLVNAPFTHPIGTELAMICVDNAWNGYDTLLKQLISEIKETCPNHPNVKKLKAEEDSNASNERLATDNVLTILGIAPSWEKVCEYLNKRVDKFHIRAPQAQTTFEIAKKLRTIRTHRLGVPSDELLKLMEGISFEEYSLRMLDGELEVTLVLSRNVSEVIDLKAQATYLIAKGLYPSIS